MATLVKGFVSKKRLNLMQLTMINGKRFWMDNRPDIDIRDFVWVAWDYTRGKPARIFNAGEYDELGKTEYEVFSTPEVEEFINEEVLDESDEEWLKRLENVIEAPEHEARSFSSPEDEEWEVRSFSDPCV